MNGAPFYVMDFVDGLHPARRAGGRGVARRGRRASGPASAWPTPWRGSTRSTSTPSGLGDLARRRGTSSGSSSAGTDSSGSHRRGRHRGGASPATPSWRVGPRAGRERHRPRRLPARQHRASPATTSVLAVLDWEICTLGDPLADLGLLMVYGPSPATRAALLGVAHGAGRLSEPGGAARPLRGGVGTRRSRLDTTWPSATGSWPASCRACTPATWRRRRRDRSGVEGSAKSIVMLARRRSSCWARHDTRRDRPARPP